MTTERGSRLGEGKQVKAVIVLPDGKTIDHLRPTSQTFMLISKLLEKQQDGSLATIPLNLLIANPEDQKQRHLADVRITDARTILKNKGWTIVLFKIDDRRGTLVSLKKIEKPTEEKDKAKPHSLDGRSNKPDPYGVYKNVPEFLKLLEEQRKKANPTSSPETGSPRDKVHS